MPPVKLIGKIIPRIGKDSKVMPPTPYIFNSRAEIVSRLRQHQQTWTGLFRDVRDQIRAKYHRLDVEEIVTASVGNNTFRAFHGCNVPPSKLFRSWGVKEFSETLEQYLNTNSQLQFDRWLNAVVLSLRETWRKEA